MWQNDLTDFRERLEELTSEMNQLFKSKDNYIVLAPTNGTLFYKEGYDIGTFINQGTKIADISPDTELIVECFINPSDIGLINSNNPVTFQIDTFNYNQWGFVKGEILEIGNDIEIVDKNPMFKVLCKANASYLQLKSGFKGYLKKGMTLNARFELVERSLFQLLYDKIDDWINPSLK